MKSRARTAVSLSVADQHLYKMDRQADHGCLNPLFHGVAETRSLREHSDSLVRVAASLG